MTLKRLSKGYCFRQYILGLSRGIAIHTYFICRHPICTYAREHIIPIKGLCQVEPYEIAIFVLQK